MSDLMPFYFERQQVRVTTGECGEPWFVAKDVCAILAYSDTHMACKKLDEDDKGTKPIETTGGIQSLLCVSEPGLYDLILGSNQPLARKFKRWVTHAVLPEIRRTGRFNGSTDRLPTHLETAEALVEALRAKEKLERQIEAERPKVEFYDRMARAEGDQTVDAIAKQLGTGEKRLFRALRSLGYLQSTSAKWNEPYQKWIDRGWFRVVRKAGHWGGREQVYRQTLITPKGLAGLYEDARFRALLPPVRQESLPGMGERALLN